MTEQRKPNKAAPVTAAVLIAAAAAAQFAGPITRHYEGLPTDGKGSAVTYVDKAGRGHPPTLCFGQTGFVRTPDGRLLEVKLGVKVPVAWCDVFLNDRQQADALPVYRITPAIAERPQVWGAILDFTHNFNVRTYEKSSMARLFAAGKWADGCRALLRYDKIGRPLHYSRWQHERRTEEMNLCLKGVK